MTDISKKIDELIYYAHINLELKQEDFIYAKNLICDILKISEPADTVVDKKTIASLTVPDIIINKIGDYAVEKGLCDNLLKSNFETAIMGIVTKNPSYVIKKFTEIAKTDVKKACAYLYDLSIKNNYIQYTAIQKNLYWKAGGDKNFLEITINLSKPEKDNKEIAKLKSMPQSGYPKCVLCYENVGFSGNYNKAARQTIRVIPVNLNGEEWFMQYSPYLYYEEHCIVINKKHIPMNVNEETFVKLFDFIDLFPNYFIGSNASLPIVGGSILNHEHFQGGLHLMPIHFSADKIKFSEIKGVKVSIPDWLNSVIRLRGKNRAEICKIANKVFKTWETYSDQNLDIICKTDLQHNAITPILRKEKDEYILDLILRNNRASEKHPDGIFHAHKEFHNIKKEGIGLIEAMGLFILPGRLKNEILFISDFLTRKTVYNETEFKENIHNEATKELLIRHPKALSEKDAEAAVKEYINGVCRKILECTAVFKNDDKGLAGFIKFAKAAGLN